MALGGIFVVNQQVLAPPQFLIAYPVSTSERGDCTLHESMFGSWILI